MTNYRQSYQHSLACSQSSKSPIKVSFLMRKLSTIAIFFSLLLVSVASACTMPFLNDNAINLNGIYNTVEPYENNTGNCLLSTDETIMFFNPVERRKIRSIMTGKIVNSQIPCLTSVASEKNWKIEQLVRILFNLASHSHNLAGHSHRPGHLTVSRVVIG